MKIKHEGRKQSPEALGVYTDKEEVESKVKELVSSGVKEDDVWFDTIYKKTEEFTKGDIVYPLWVVEGRRPVMGCITSVKKTKELAEKYIEEECVPKAEMRAAGIKGILILECEFKG